MNQLIVKMEYFSTIMADGNRSSDTYKKLILSSLLAAASATDAADNYSLAKSLSKVYLQVLGFLKCMDIAFPDFRGERIKKLAELSSSDDFRLTAKRETPFSSETIRRMANQLNNSPFSWWDYDHHTMPYHFVPVMAMTVNQRANKLLHLDILKHVESLTLYD